MSPDRAWPRELPFIDPEVEYAGATKLRSFNASNLAHLKKTLVLQDDGKPLAVMMSYAQYQTLQKKLQEALTALEVLGREETGARLRQGPRDISEGRVSAAAKAKGKRT